jgi:hypothetical protein
MFAKLLRHEWRATVGGQGGLCGAILSLGALSAGCVTILFTNSNKLNDLTVGSIGMSVMFLNMAIFLCAAAAAILLLVRFYRSRFTDQGYLTFTLPVTVHQNFWSAFVNMLIWQVLVFLAVIAALAMSAAAAYFTIGDLISAEFAEYLQQMQYFYGEELENIREVLRDLVPVYLLQLVMGVVYNIVISLTCLTVGATLAKKHKILAAIGVYYLISAASGMIGNVLTMSVTLRLDEIIEGTNPQAMGKVMQQLLTMTVPLQLVMIVGCYLLATTFMKKKLNLN